jgi:choline dehydrogenase
VSTGLPIVEDGNDPNAPSMGYCHLDVAVDDRGYRHSTNRAFLPTQVARDRREHLRICVHTLVRKLEFTTEIDGNLRVHGVHFQSLDPRQPKKVCFARARKEVILCAGALGSPHLLMLRYWIPDSTHSILAENFRSGIGPREHLDSLSIKVIRDIPGVGSNLVSVLHR